MSGSVDYIWIIWVVSPILGLLFFNFLFSKIFNKTIFSIRLTLELTSIFFIIAISNLSGYIWGVYYYWVAVVFLIVIAMIIMIWRFKHDESLHLIKVIRLTLRIGFLLLSITYIGLFGFIIMNYFIK